MAGEANDTGNSPFRRDSDGGTRAQRDRRNTGSPWRRAEISVQPVIREDQTGLLGMADGFAVPVRPSNVGGGKGPEFKANAVSGKGRRRLGQ